jgi:hypothetical protein
MSAGGSMVGGQATSKQELLDQFQKSTRPVDDLIDILLSEELTSYYRKLIVSYDDTRGLPSGLARGCLLFLLMHHDATSPPDRSDWVEKLNVIAQDADFQLAFETFYEIPQTMGLRKLAFHAVGTTSIIFKAVAEQGLCALKVIQAQYVRIPAIQEATLRYMENNGLHVLHSPTIFKSTRRWILMSFVEGANLNDYLGSLRNKAAFPSDEYVSAISSIFRMLVEALAYYESRRPSIVHGDLTPFNVMVEFDATGPKAVKLIDFGANHVLQQRLGSRRSFAQAFARTELFVAPEVVKGADPSRDADLYSLGMIGLDMMSPTALRSEAVGSRLRDIWQNPASVGLAEIIEDLIDEDPANRLLMQKKQATGSEPAIYEMLAKASQSHFDLYRALQKEREHYEPSRFWRSLIIDIKNAAKDAAAIAGNRVSSYTRWQPEAAALNLLLHRFIVWSFVLYTALDVSTALGTKMPMIGGIVEKVAVALKYYPNWIDVGDWRGNLPGRAVALTFGLIATRYYANIYSSLAVTGLGSWLQMIANALLRFNSFSYFPPIMYAIVVDPHAWPFCAFLGTLFPALNNLACWIVARRGLRKAADRFSVEAYHRAEDAAFLTRYLEWFSLMLGYSVGILVIGIALHRGWAHDEEIYAGLICAINIIKIYRTNCGKEAPVISGNLARSFFYVRRLA